MLCEVNWIIAVLNAATRVAHHCLARGSAPPDTRGLRAYAKEFAQRLREMSGDRVPWVAEIMCRRADQLDEAADRLWLAMIQLGD